MTADAVTVLRCSPGHRATKRWTLDPDTDELSVEGYDAGVWFSVAEHPAGSLEDLAGVIDQCRRDPRAFVILGEPLDGIDRSRTRRLLYRQPDGVEPTFRAVARRWLALDFDEVPGPFRFDPADAELAAVYCMSKLPPEFARASFLWQATSSCGFKPGCRVRLWFWLDRPLSTAEADRWLGHCPVDPSVWRPIQPIFTADPILGPGVEDPVVGKRFGIEYDRDDMVTVPELPEPAPEPARVAPTHDAQGRRYISGQPRSVAERRLDALCRGVERAAKGHRHRCLMWAAARAVELDDAIPRAELAAALVGAMRVHGDITETDADLERQVRNGFKIGVFDLGMAS